MKRTLLFTLITILLLGATASPALSQGIEAQPEVTTGRGEGSENAVVHAVLFWMDGCPHCHDVLDHVLPPLEEKYGAQLEITLVEIKSQEDFDGLLDVADSYGIPKERVGVPFLIIGDQVLIGSGQIPAELPDLIESYLAQGGVALPALPAFSDRLPDSSRIEEDCPTPLSCGIQTVTPTLSLDRTSTPTPTASAVMNGSRPAATLKSGFTLAIVIMVLMAASLVYSLIAVALGKSFSLPTWTDWLIPVLILIGLGIAGYLSYVETQPVEAVCGPIGDCNTVQSSPYAMLFGVLPVGVLGFLGYLGLLTAWAVRRWLPKWEHLAGIAFWFMAVFAVAFSTYLTYLEPFVIHAVCSWCLTSSVIVTLLLLLSTPHAAQVAFASEQER